MPVDDQRESALACDELATDTGFPRVQHSDMLPELPVSQLSNRQPTAADQDQPWLTSLEGRGVAGREKGWRSNYQRAAGRPAP